MADEIPSGAKRYFLSEYERFPTLSLDDGSWRGDPMGSEPPGFYPTDHTIILPVALFEMWEKACADLRALERLINEIDRVQDALRDPPPPPTDPVT